VEAARASDGYAGCSVDRFFAWGSVLDDSVFLPADTDGVSRNDLWMLRPRDALLEITVYHRVMDFAESTLLSTPIPAFPGDVYLAGDHDRDGQADLFVIRREGVTRLEVWDGAARFTTKVVDDPIQPVDATGWQFAIGDRDVDGRLDVYAIDPFAGLVTVLGGDDYRQVLDTFAVAPAAGAAVALAVGDLDGDGRDDLYLLGPDGRLEVLMGGNGSGSGDPSAWFRDPDWECSDDALPYGTEGPFRDDDGSVFEADVEWLAAAGITKGCNPPFNDAFCPGEPVTRGQMAAFLVRALGLTDEGSVGFVDDDGSVFEADIERMAAAGITKGCNPPVADRFCPDRFVTRAEVAAFLHRALGEP
jgi:hypothetical protein